MDADHFSLEQIALCTGMDIHRIQERRKASGVEWHSGTVGYTAQEAAAILEGVQLRPRVAMDTCRSRKAQELWYRLGGRADD